MCVYIYLLCIAALRPCPRVTAARLIFYQVNVGTEDESYNTRVPGYNFIYSIFM